MTRLSIFEQVTRRFASLQLVRRWRSSFFGRIPRFPAYHSGVSCSGVVKNFLEVGKKDVSVRFIEGIESVSGNTIEFQGFP